MESRSHADEHYPHVFTPIRVGPIEVANRIYFPPHSNPLSSEGAPSSDFAYYYAERAAGGCGLLIHGLPVLPVTIGRQCPYYEEAVPSFRSVARLVHLNGAKIFAQLHYWWGNPGQWEPNSPMRPILGPSARQRFDHFTVTHEMNVTEIEHVVHAYRRGAHHLALAGYDGVELHMSHGTLAEQFLSPYWNGRTDGYGGDVGARLRFAIEALKAIREGAGSGLAVGMRFNCNEMLPGGWTQEDTRTVLACLVDTGLIDFADLDIAVEPNQMPLGMPNYFVPKHSNATFVANVRDAAGSTPVLSALGRVTSISEAEDAIASGICDLVGAARGLIAEPHLVKNAREGREDLSRTCIGWNWCMTATKNALFGCAINPESGRERRWGPRTTASAVRRRKVVVVGGGPGGLEAARVAAKRGHEVVLLERRAALGGQLALWASLPGRDGFAAATKWWKDELYRLDVDVRLGVDATADSVLTERPAAVVVATGSRYASDGESGFLSTPIPGFDRDFVITPEQVLEDGARPTGKVVILDDEGINTGAGIAQLLAQGGTRIELITRWMQHAENVVYTLESAFIIPILKSLGVMLVTQTYVKEIGNHEVTLFDVFTNEQRVVTEVNGVVLATMRRPIAGLASELDGAVEQLFLVGDALAPRGVAEATYEGHRFARFIGEENAPSSFADAYFTRVPNDALPAPAATIDQGGGRATTWQKS
jgi:2,4-dienoyl-CoA reductase-like NADH-dependent reductase (Old Yellow Enzyme family)